MAFWLKGRLVLCFSISQQLTIPYDFVALICKLLSLLPDWHKYIFSTIMELVCNSSLTLNTGFDKQIKLRRLENGFPLESVLILILFNIYIHHRQATTARKVAFADNLTIFHSASNWLALEGALIENIATLSSYPGNGSSS